MSFLLKKRLIFSSILTALLGLGTFAYGYLQSGNIADTPAPFGFPYAYWHYGSTLLGRVNDFSFLWLLADVVIWFAVAVVISIFAYRQHPQK